MKKSIVWTVVGVLFTFVLGYQVSASLAQARGQAPAPAAGPVRPAPGNMSEMFELIPKSDMDALRAVGGDRPARVLNVGNKYHLGVFSLTFEPRQPRAEEPLTSFYHSEVSEVYYILRGSGTAALGGEMEKATWDDSNSRSIRVVRGPSVNGTMKGHKLVKWTAGDTVVVAAGVPHSFGYEVTEKAEIMRVVIDPSKSIELQSKPELPAPPR
jgi:mannose-6-phosphate isomerase-like protein (cupin superfamily)